MSGGDEQIAVHCLNHNRDFYTIPVKFRSKILVPQRIRPIIDQDDAGIIIQAPLFIVVIYAEDLEEGWRADYSRREGREIDKEGNQCRKHYGDRDQEQYRDRMGESRIGWMI